MRVALLLTASLLAGCSLFNKPTDVPLPKQPDAPTTASVVQTLGKDLDKTDHRVGAALVAIERNADKPKVVVAESRLAQSYLPPPPEADVAFAVARAAKQDPIDYAKQMEFGRKLATAVNRAWEKLEADQAEAKRVSGLKDARIVALTAEVEQVKKDAAKNIWTITGAALAVIGAIATALTGPKVGIPLILCGAFCGAVPFIIDSEYFSYIAGTTLAACAGLGIWFVWDKVRDSNKASDYEPPKI
jgi:hypothetical protein